MRIAIEACCWSNRRGYGRYLRELVTNMVAEFPHHEFILVVDGQTASESRFPEGARVEVVRTRVQPTRAASAQGSRSPMDLWRMGRAASRLRPDVFFFPTRYSYYPLHRKIPTIIAFHDATGEKHPDLIFPGARSRLLWALKTWLAFRQADRIVTVSESSRSQIAAAFRTPESAIHVVLEGPVPSFRPLEDRSVIPDALGRHHLPADRPLLLYVGGISPHKNLQGLFHALTRVQESSQVPWHLGLVGDYANDSFYGCHRELTELSSRLGLAGRITFTGFVPDDDLIALYNAATMLVLPSFNEGFGLPVVEAMACGLPVAASDRGSLPEVLGPLGTFFDPTDHGAMAAVIVRILNDPDLRASLRDEGLRRVKRFSWKTAAREMVHLFEEMVPHASKSA